MNGPVNMESYEYIGHTADVGLRAHGKTRAEAFENAARGMFDLICDISGVRQRESFPIALESAGGDETLLADWLNELLYLHESRGLLFSGFSVEVLEAGRLRGEARGERIDSGSHILRAEIKAVTYHMLQIKREQAGWSVQVLFDV